MMTKKQKTWLGIFLAMFVVPEVLWGPVLGAVYLFSKVNIKPIFPNSQILNDHFILIILILICELVGAAGMMGLVIKNKNLKKITKGVILCLLFLIILALLVVFYMSFALNSTWS